MRLLTNIRANAVAYAAIFLALSGGAYAASSLPQNSIVSKSIKNGQVRSADVRNDGLRGVDIREATLAQVPSAASAELVGDAGLLGGSPAAVFQPRITESCGGGTAIAGVEGNDVDCARAVFPINFELSADSNRSLFFGVSDVVVNVSCHFTSAGTTETRITFGSGSAATLNWMFSEGGATSTVNAGGTSLGGGGSIAFDYEGARIEGQFVIFDAQAVRTVNLHVFDGTSFCEATGTAQFAALP